MSGSDTNIFEFGDFRLLPAEGLLLRHDEPVPLSIKAFATLVFLVEHHGHVVQKSELLDEVWGETFVEEGAVSRCVWNIRRALGDKSKEKFIQTVPRRGYRFIFPVFVVSDPLPGVGVAHLPQNRETDNDQTFPAEIARSRTIRRSVIYAVIGTVLLLGASLYSFRFGSLITAVNPALQHGTSNEETSRFYQQAENLSERRNQENIPVAMDYLNQAITLDPEFARAWAAKAHLHRYIAEYPGADQAEQYKRSMDAVEKALAIDPNLSEAHSALCLNKFRYEYDTVGAESACVRAVELDPASSVGHKAYATFLYSHGRFDEAIHEIKHALDLQPLALENQQTYALALYYARRYEEEEAQWKRLKELNPTHGFIYTRLFINLKQQGKDDKAFDFLIKKLAGDHVDNEVIERFRTAYAVSGWRGVTVERIKHPETESFTGPFDLACLYATLGETDKAFEYLERAYVEHSYRIAVLQVEPQLDPLRADARYSDLVRRIEGGSYPPR